MTATPRDPFAPPASGGGPKPPRLGFRRGHLSDRQSRALTGLAMIYSLRMLGLYMVLPVLSIYALQLEGASDLLTGFSVGAYGLTQGLLQIPMGRLSDRIGRKGVIALGLGLFAAGSVLAGLSTHIYTLIAGRILQGSGAVAAAVVALAADLSPDHARTQAMARLGAWLGVSLALGIVAGPAVSDVLGVPALFFATAALSVGGIVYLHFAVPEPKHVNAADSRDAPLSAEIVEQIEGVSPIQDDEIRAADLKSVLARPRVLLICLGVFLIHTLLTAILVIMPVKLTQFVDQKAISLILAPTAVFALALMLISARVADRLRQRHLAFLLGVLLLVAANATFAAAPEGLVGLATGVSLFLMALVLLEPLLSSLISQHAPKEHRGTTLGVYHMSLFFGATVGGPVGGAFLSGTMSHLFAVAGVGSILWALLITRHRKRFFYPTQEPE